MFILSRILICIALLSGISAFGQKRATPEQRAKRAAENRHLLDDPVTNYKKITVYFLQLAQENKTLSADFSRRLENSESNSEKAALYYLLAESRYFDVIANVRMKRDRTELASLGEYVIGTLLKSYELCQTDEVNDLRTDVCRLLINRLGSGMCGDTRLSAELRNKVVRTFVDVESGRKDSAFADLPEKVKAHVFSNLGILERLHKQLPKGLPDDYKALCNYLNDAEAIMADQPALNASNKLWNDHSETLARDASNLGLVSKVFCKHKTPNSVKALEALCDLDPSAYLLLHHYNMLQGKGKLNDDNRYPHLDAYLDRVGKNPQKDPTPYSRVIQLLLDEEDYGGALIYVKKLRTHKPFHIPTLLNEVKCHIGLRNYDEALLLAERIERRTGSQKHIQAIARRLIAKIKTIKETEK